MNAVVTDATEGWLRTRLARVTVAAGLAVLTWLVGLVALGTVAGMESVSPLALVPLLVIALMAWPLYRAAPWRPGLAERTLSWLVRTRYGLAVAAGIAVLRTLPVTPGLVQFVLDVPFRAAGLLFGARLFYAERLGAAAAGRLVLQAGLWYLEALWLVLLGTTIVRLWGSVR